MKNGKKKIKNSLSGIGAPKLIKGKLKEELKECKYFSIGAKRDIDKIFYKVHYWKDLDNNNSKNTVKNKEDIIEDLNNDSEIDGVRYEWNPDDLSSVSVRKYFCDKNVNGESINKHIIKYSTYDMSLYNSITNMVSDLLSSPLREEVSIIPLF